MLTPRRDKHQGGTALVLTLWLLALISALALSFALSARSGSAVARNFKESVILRSMAVEAIENTVAYILADPDTSLDYIDEDGQLRTDRERQPVPQIVSSGRGTVYLTLSAEDARININKVNETVLRNLLDDIAEGEDRASMVSALMDWKDPDELHRLNGAEDSYYTPRGYKTSGKPLETMEELLLVRGFDKDKLVSGGKDKKFPDLITTFTKTLNINAAPYEVLRALGRDTVSASSLIEMRRSYEGLKSVPGDLSKISKSFRGTTFSNVFRIEAQAALEGSPQVYHITSIVERFHEQGRQEIKTIYWKEDIEAGGA